MQGLPIIMKRQNLQSLDKALDLFVEFKFCESDFYFLNGSKNCMVATYNFGSVYRLHYRKIPDKDLLLTVCISRFIYLSNFYDPSTA